MTIQSFIRMCMFVPAVGIMTNSHFSVRAAPPNIVVVLCDDLGYGDVSCLNPERGRIATEAIDRLAHDGMIFTDAHSGSSVCTPTRYGLLTGRYSWRTRLQRGVLEGFAPCLIAPDRPTVASFLQAHGYYTGIIGKWHLDFQYQDPTTGETLAKTDVKDKGKPKSKGLAPVGSRIPDGPIHRGFNYFHGFHHARDMKGVIENDEVILHDEEINMLPRLTHKAAEFIDERAKLALQNPGELAPPFFLYVPFGSPHTPILPTKAWRGKSGLGDYADFVMQTDAGLGVILDALQRHQLADNTLVIFSSDNGCSKAAGISKLQEQGHYPSAHMRGSKADIWDGGHRVPFVVRWPGVVAPGTTSRQTICLTDLFATCADLVGQSVPEGSAEDSVSFLPALRGDLIDSRREGVIHHSISGHFAYRAGPWKLCLAKGSGGWSSPGEKQMPKGSPAAQLYNLDDDPGETENLYESRPEIAQRLLRSLISDVSAGRSTQGPYSANDVDDIELWKSGKPAKRMENDRDEKGTE